MQDRTAVAGPATNSQHSPYVGPRPFTTADRDIFFGRNQEAIELSSLIKAHPEVLLYAPSGAGKTSLLYAQVLPILENDEDFDMLPLARVRSQESAIIPDEKINNIYVFNALKDLSNDKLSVLERGQLTIADFLARQPRALSGEWERQPGDQDAPERRLPRIIVFDQFEEIFTLYPERYKDREGFFRQVADALEADPFLRVVFSMREDYIAELDPYTDILPQGMRTRFRLERLRKSNALACVKRPLETDRCKETRRYFEDNVAESLVDRLMAIKVKSPSGEKIEVPGEFVDPVQLQVVCQTLWEKLPPDDIAISKEDIDKYANVEEALLDFYESSIRKAVIAANSSQATAAGAANSPVPPAISEGVVRGWFEQKLITRENKRNMVNRERQMTAGLPNVVVDELDKQHLIRVEMRGGEPWYELSHDRFIPPIRESNRRFLLQQPVAKRKAQELEQRAEEWWNAQRDPDLLLDRGELADAQNWMRTEAAAIGYSNNLYALVQASEAAIQHEENLRQQALADALQQKATVERQRSRQMKIGWVVTSVLLLFTVGSTVFAFNRWQKASDEEFRATKALGAEKEAKKDVEKALGFANDETLKATSASQKAVAALAEVEKQKREVELQKGEAERQKAKADELRKAATAARDLAIRHKTDAEMSASEAVRNYGDAMAAKLAGDARSQLGSDPELSVRLALNALISSPHSESAKTSLRHSYQRFTGHRTLTGHSDDVKKAIFSPDGRYIFTGSEDNTARMWDAGTGQELRKFEGHARGIHALAVSPDGTLLATEAGDSSGKIWRTKDGTVIANLADLSGPTAALAFSPDGRVLATEASESEEEAGWAPRIWDAATGKVLHRLKGHRHAVVALAFSPNGHLLVTASWDHTARVWNVATGRELFALEGHTAPLTSVAFNRDGTAILTGSYDSTARIWEASTGKQIAVLKGHKGAVRHVAFSPKGDLILTSGRKIFSTLENGAQIPLPAAIPTNEQAPDDNTIRLYTSKGQPVRIFTGHTNVINDAVFSSNGKMIASVSQDGSSRIWDVQTGISLVELQPTQRDSEENQSKSKNSAVLSPDDQFVLTAGADMTAEVWRLDSLGPKAVFRAHNRAVSSIRVSGHGNELVTTSHDGAYTWDASSGQIGTRTRGPLLPAATNVFSAAVSPDGKLIVTGSKTSAGDRNAHVFESPTGPPLDLIGHTSPVRRVSFSPNGTYIVTIDTHNARVWKSADRMLVKTFDPIPGAKDVSGISDVALSADERYVAIAYRNGTVQTFELATGNLLVRYALHEKPINTVAFNTDTAAPLIVTSSTDGTARICAAIYDKCFSTLRGHTKSVTYAGFSPDNRLIVTVGLDQKIRVWDADSGGLITELKVASRQSFTSAAFNDDGTRVFAGTQSGHVLVFSCDACRPFEVIKDLAEKLNPRQLSTQEHQDFMILR